MHIAVWSCNGALWTHPRRLEEVLIDKDNIALTEIHDSSERGLPRFDGYQLESLHTRGYAKSHVRDHEALHPIQTGAA